MPINDYNKKKPLEVSSTNDSGTTQDKAQPILIVGETSGGDAYNISDANFEKSEATEDSDPRDVLFNNDGTKVYTIDNNSDEIYQSILSTAFDISTRSFDTKINSSDSIPLSIAFNDDGTKLYETGQGSQQVYEYDLSTAYDISTASLSQTEGLSGSPRDISFNNDGTKMFIVNSSNEVLEQYTLSTAYNVTTKSLDKTFNLSDTQPDGATWNDNGTKFYESGSFSNKIYEYNLSTAFDIGTATFNQSINSQDDIPTGIAWNNDGSKLYESGAAGAAIYQSNINGGSSQTEDKTGTGDIVIDFSNISDAQDIAVYDENGNLLDYEIESLDTSAETGVIWAYDSWVRDDTVQAQVAYGDNSANDDRSVAGTGSNPWTNEQYFSVHEMRETYGNDFDSVTRTNTGIDGTQDTDGQFSNAGEFDGLDDDISTEGEQGSGSTTIEAWFKTTNNPSEEAILHISGSNSNILRLDQKGGNIRIGCFDGNADGFTTLTSSNTYNDGNWHQAVAIIDVSSGKFRLYIDGSQVASSNTGNNPDFSGERSDRPSRIGSRESGNHFTGDIDNAKVFKGLYSNESSYIQAGFDASPKAGQVYFSQQASETAGTNFDGTTNTATASGLGKTINLSGTTTANINTATGSGTGNTIFLEAEFVTLAATASVTGGSANLAGTTTITVITAEASGSGGTSTLTQIIQAVSASAQSSGQIINLDRLTGTVDVEGQPTSGVDVNVVDKTNNILHETTTDSNGNWVVDSGDGILYQVAYLFDDGTTFFGDAEESDTT